MKQKHYLLIKKNNFKQAVFNFSIEGYKIKPKDNVKNKKISVKKMILVKPEFIKSILKKKIKRRLDVYVEYIIELIEDDEDADSDRSAKALDDIERYRSLIRNNYRIYLEKKHIDLLLKKLEILEKELKKKHLEQIKKETKNEKNDMIDDEIEFEESQKKR